MTLDESDFQHCGTLTSVDSDEYVQPPLSSETPNDVRSVALVIEYSSD